MSEIQAKDSFLPFVRMGLCADITEVDHLGAAVGANKERASVKVEVRVNDSTTDKVTKDILIHGPGDVTGIQSKAIVRSMPQEGTVAFEPNYLPFIEFYEEDFLWRYTPAKASGEKLRPWLVLLVLKTNEFEQQQPLNGPLPFIRLNPQGLANAFPHEKETWAWAHVHVNRDLDPNNKGNVAGMIDTLNVTVKADGDLACCRLLSTRRLEQNTAYTCFLIPAFETGRRTGLGIETNAIEAQKASFQQGQTAITDYPFYHSWRFRTGSSGDFETLVKKLVPREMSATVGKLPMDIQAVKRPANGDGTVMLEGVLRVANSAPEAPLSTLVAIELGDHIRKKINAANELQKLPPNGKEPSQYWSYDLFGLTLPKPTEDWPVLAPPIYGCWAAQVKRLDTALPAAPAANWVHQLNLDPSLRAVAGLGAEVVRRNQESFMKSAWEQFGEVMEANRKLNAAQYAKEANGAIYRKHIQKQKNERVFALSSGMHGMVLESTTTVWENARLAGMGEVAQSATFRRATRPMGPIARRMGGGPNWTLHNNLVTGLSASSIQANVAKKMSTAQNTVAVDSINILANFPQTKTITATTKFAIPRGEVPVPIPNDNLEATNFKAAVAYFNDFFNPAKWPQPAPAPALDLGKQVVAIQKKLNPAITIPAAVAAKVLVNGQALSSKEDRVDTLSACPKISLPGYKPLMELSREYLLPKMDLIPENTLALLEINQAFIEAYMVGMNHEMMREMLWREYPTDQRGTVFQYFWDTADFDLAGISEADRREKSKDINELHTWPKTAKLGENSPRAKNGTSSKLILLVRGDFLQRYPNAVVYAAKAEWAKRGNGMPDLYGERTRSGEEKMPLFTAKVNSDITMMGFDLTPAEAHGMSWQLALDTYIYKRTTPGWFFVFEERVGDARFGMDEAPAQTPAAFMQSYTDLSWGHVNLNKGHIKLGAAIAGNTTPAEWGKNAAHMAFLLYQDPVRVLIHASSMMPQEKSPQIIDQF